MESTKRNPNRWGGLAGHSAPTSGPFGFICCEDLDGADGGLRCDWGCGKGDAGRTVVPMMMMSYLGLSLILVFVIELI